MTLPPYHNTGTGPRDSCADHPRCQPLVQVSGLHRLHVFPSSMFWPLGRCDGGSGAALVGGGKATSDTFQACSVSYRAALCTDGNAHHQARSIRAWVCQAGCERDCRHESGGNRYRWGMQLEVCPVDVFCYIRSAGNGCVICSVTLRALESMKRKEARTRGTEGCDTKRGGGGGRYVEGGRRFQERGQTGQLQARTIWRTWPQRCQFSWPALERTSSV